MKSQTLAVPGHVRVKKDSAVNGLSIMLCKHESCKRPECVAAFAVRINNPCYEDKQNLLTITGFCTGHCHVDLCLPLQCCTGILLILGIFAALLLRLVGACTRALFGEALVVLNGILALWMLQVGAVVTFSSSQCQHSCLGNTSGILPGQLGIGHGAFHTWLWCHHCMGIPGKINELRDP